MADVFPAKLITESNNSSISFLASWTPFGLARLTGALAAGGGGGGGGGGADPETGGGGGGGADAETGGGGGAPPLELLPLLIPSSARSLSVSKVMSMVRPLYFVVWWSAIVPGRL